MKFIAMVAIVLSLFACQSGKTETTTGDSTAVTTVVDTTVKDSVVSSAAAVVDTTPVVAPVDSAK